MKTLSTFNFLFRQKIITWKREEEDEAYAVRAIELLIKKLNKSKEMLTELERALACPNKQFNCVTIPRSIDGRLQVLHKKCLAHVIYCRLWRWPDIQSHRELTPTIHCQHSYSAHHNVICINPYHYNRVPYRKNPSVVAPRTSLSATFSGTNSFLDSCSSLTNSAPMISDSVVAEKSCEPFSVWDRCLDKKSETSRKVTEDKNCTFSVLYYEQNSRVGPVFRSQGQSVVIDGFTNPNGENSRISLGQLSNINRNSTVEKARRHIGRGVQIYLEKGQVYANCLSQSSIFLHSPSCNMLHALHSSTVCKVSFNNTLRVFDNEQFIGTLSKQANLGYEAVFDLTKMCIIRLSFVKGWGGNYHRHDITSTPCWVEVHLHQPLQWIDKVLTKMRGPDQLTSSTS